MRSVLSRASSDLARTADWAREEELNDGSPNAVVTRVDAQFRGPPATRMNLASGTPVNPGRSSWYSPEDVCQRSRGTQLPMLTLDECEQDQGLYPLNENFGPQTDAQQSQSRTHLWRTSVENHGRSYHQLRAVTKSRGYKQGHPYMELPYRRTTSEDIGYNMEGRGRPQARGGGSIRTCLR